MAVADVCPGGGKETVEWIRVAGREAELFEVDVTDEARWREWSTRSSSASAASTWPTTAPSEGHRVRLYETGTDGLAQDGVAQRRRRIPLHEVRAGSNARTGCDAIVDALSTFGLAGGAGGPYPASKHAVVGLTSSVAVDYAENGVRVNSIHRGDMETPMIERLRADPVPRRSARHDASDGPHGSAGGDRRRSRVAMLRRRYIRYLVARWSPMEETWLGDLQNLGR